MILQRKIVAIIPARAGSKRIPSKNIKQFVGVSMIKRTIETLLRADLFDQIVASTDSEEISQISLDAGATQCISRPHELADDHTPTKPVIQHALNELALRENDGVCCV